MSVVVGAAPVSKPAKAKAEKPEEAKVEAAKDEAEEKPVKKSRARKG